jgi:lysophospholipase L1-like esterase
MNRHSHIMRWAVVCLLAACISVVWLGHFSHAFSAGQELPEEPSSNASQSLPEDDFTQSSPPIAEETTDTPLPEPAETVPEQPAYDFSQPLAESEPVENDYFADAAFVGDSRTDGFLIYSGIGCGKNLTSNGLSIFQLESKKVLTIDGVSYTLMEALALEQYGKVYLSLGVNELGYFDDEGFYRSYCQAIDDIRALQPNAVIYIQGLIPLNESVIAATSQRSYLKNDHLRIYNDIMRQVAEEKQVVFLDLYSEFVDENGELPAEASRDGIHLTKAYCQQWLSYLKTHTIAFDSLYPDGVPQTGASDSGTEAGSVLP